MPLGQSDGGRDAISRVNKNGFIVFQVKFVGNPARITAPHVWLQKTLSEEMPKIKNLIPSGALEYILITNIAGTGSLGSGSIDRVHELLQKEVGIPAACWWRDDVSRRLDNAFDLKWKYPEILSGVDLLRVAFESTKSEDEARRSSTIRTFLRSQFERDKEIRFRQVEIQADLLDLFVDIGFFHAPSFAERSRIHASFDPFRSGRRVFHAAKTLDGDSDSVRLFEGKLNIDNEPLGTAGILLSEKGQAGLQRVVLEGGPGQGKSTLVQYVCQVHRGRLLNKYGNDTRIPRRCREAPVRLPFKLDCRDFSMWLEKKDPFRAENEIEGRTDWLASLETFLVAMVRYESGGTHFSVSDLHAVIQLTPTLIVFDGLDEVANISLRENVVNEIVKGVNRLGELSPSIQVIATSRPVGFLSSRGLPENAFAHLMLDPLGVPEIEIYTAKWFVVRRVAERDAFEVRNILQQKLNQAHLFQIARNPMQLAILLSLILARGGSLPDKRTALYDGYLDYYMSREAEKSSVVREWRDDLIAIHRYLAWVIHSDAQLNGTRGNVSHNHLRLLIHGFFKTKGEGVQFADDIFSGVVERVGLLVSRVEDTYEFEVQTMREYFAARYLYDTAQYSPVGNERSGTLPERFDALARDSYWLNVLRFYSGCYSTGELSSLADCLEEFASSDEFKVTIYPFQLASILLSDRIFSRQPKLMRRVIGILFHGLDLLVAHPGAPSETLKGDWLEKDSKAIRELLDICFTVFRNHWDEDRYRSYCAFIRAIVDSETIYQNWILEYQKADENSIHQWLWIALWLGVISKAKWSAIADRLPQNSIRSDCLLVALLGGASGAIRKRRELFCAVLDRILDGRPTEYHSNAESILTDFAYFFVEDDTVYTRRWGDDGEMEFGLRDALLSISDSLPSAGVSSFPEIEKVDNYLAFLGGDRQSLRWEVEAIEYGRELFGERLLFFVVANELVNHIASEDAAAKNAMLFDEAYPLLERVASADVNHVNSSWWHSQIAAVETDSHLIIVVFLLFVRAESPVIEDFIDVLHEKLETLHPEQWEALADWVLFGLRSHDSRNADFEIQIPELPESLSERLAVLLASRTGRAERKLLYDTCLKRYSGTDRFVWSLCLEVAVSSAAEDPDNWDSSLDLIARSYLSGGEVYLLNGFDLGEVEGILTIPVDIASKIVRNSYRYPEQLLIAAESICQSEIQAVTEPVGEVALKKKWFGNE